MIKNCLVCSREFKINPARIKNGNGRFCSKKCAHVLQKNKVKRKCQICNKEFKVIPSQIKKGGGKFCSIECYGVWQSKNRSGKNHPSWKGGNVGKKCPICGEEFNIKPYRIRQDLAKFCSYKCYGVWQSVNRRGENSPVWKGGRATIPKMIRSSLKYKGWREKIFHRDNFTCQKCKIKGGYLHAHHLKKFSVILNDIKQKFPLLSMTDIAESYSDLWDISNGITLCKSCHKKEHKNGRTNSKDRTSDTGFNRRA